MKVGKVLLALIGSITVLGYYFVTRSAARPSDVEIIQKTRNQASIQGGDIIFQTSRSSQSKAIQLATKSKYSHMGIVYEANGQLYVYEAVQPVKLTKLNEWIRRGENGHYVVKRLRNAQDILTETNLRKMTSYGNRFQGRDYDIYFEWSDDRIYCSELVWKIYKEVLDVEIGELQELREFDLTSPVVKAKMKERYGDKVPLNEKVISPARMFESNRLQTVVEGR